MISHRVWQLNMPWDWEHLENWVFIWHDWFIANFPPLDWFSQICVPNVGAVWLWRYLTVAVVLTTIFSKGLNTFPPLFWSIKIFRLEKGRLQSLSWGTFRPRNTVKSSEGKSNKVDLLELSSTMRFGHLTQWYARSLL